MTSAANDSSRVAFVGAGQMGLPMVRRLVAAGHDVVVHGRRPDARAECEAIGATATDDIRGAVAGADVTIACVFSDVQLREAALGPTGFVDAMAPGSILVIHTTGSPATAQLLAEQAADHGVRVVDAPVSGSAADIDAGRITVMLGGAPDDVEAARRIVSAYSEQIFHVGPLGSAQLVKLLNNALFAAHLQLAAEVERLTSEMGVTWSDASSVFLSSSGASRAIGIAQSMGSVQALVDAGGHYLVKDVAEAVATAATLGLDLGQVEAVNRHGPLRFLGDAAEPRELGG